MRTSRLVCLSAALSLSALSISKTTLDEITWSEPRAWQCAKSISIPAFKVSGEFKGKRPQTEYTKSFAAALAESLKRSGRFESVVLLDEGRPPATDLALEGDFLKLTTGSRAGRFWIGCGVGRSKCQVRITCYRVSDHAKVFELEHARLSAEGLKSDELQENIEEVEADVSEVLIGAKQGCPDVQAPSPPAASGALDPQPHEKTPGMAMDRPPGEHSPSSLCAGPVHGVHHSTPSNRLSGECRRAMPCS